MLFNFKNWIAITSLISNKNANFFLFFFYFVFLFNYYLKEIREK